jgi:hypothetical protein
MARFIFKFAGGPLDGKTVSGDPRREGEAERYYALSHHGRVGQRFRIASDYAINILTREHLKGEESQGFQPHVYEVMDRIDNGDVVLVRTQYVPVARGRRKATG